MTAGASRLLELMDKAGDVAPDARSALLRELADVFLTGPDRFSAAERAHFDAILTILTREASPALRREIAERLADTPAAPKGVVLALARDEINVAEPVLRRSQALGEQELLDLLREGGPGHWKAAARRRDLSEAVCEFLTETNDEDTLVTLAKNQSARFSMRAIHTLIHEARRRQALQAPLTGRHDLPPQLLTQLYFFVSTHLKKEILARTEFLDPSLVEVAVTANRRRILEQAMREAEAQHSDAKRFIADKIRAGAVDEALLKALIAEKQYTEFLFAFAWLAGVDMAAAQTILKDRTFESLAVVCRAIGVERQTFAKIVFNLKRDNHSKAMALRILDIYIKVPVEAADRIMRFWRMRTKEGRNAAFTNFADEDDSAQNSGARAQHL